MMRPQILNPLFAETEAMKGVGATLAKPLGRLRLKRVVDIAFHLPITWIDRKAADVLDMADAGQIITITLTAVDYRQAGGRGPFRIHASDASGNYVSLVYFGGDPGWARKLLPLGEARLVSGKLELYGQDLQIVHPDFVVPPADPLS